MATTTPKLGLNKPGSGEYGWDALLGQNIDTLDAVVGGLVDERAVTGTATGGSATTLDDSGASWGANAWAGAIVVIRRGGVVLRAEQVTSNTATQLTFASGAAVQAGDAYTIMAQANAIPVAEKGAANGVATLDANSKLVQMPTAADVGAGPVLGYTPENAANRGVANGYAATDANNEVKHLPAGAAAAAAIDPARVLRADGTWGTATGGKILQVVQASTDGLLTTTAAGAPNVQTNGVQIFSLAFTPLAATSSILVLTSPIYIGESVNNGDVCWLALWDGATFIAAHGGTPDAAHFSGSLNMTMAGLNILYPAGSTATRTISVRGGKNNGADTTYINGNTWSNPGGASQRITMTVMEVAA